MKIITMFNNKGGVGKTTFVVNLADAMADLGKKILLVDADAQCNLSAFYLDEESLDNYLGDSDVNNDSNFNTIWAGLRPVVLGRGDVKPVNLYDVRENVKLLVGDVLISQYEEELPMAWIDSFARKTRGYDVVTAFSRLLHAQINEYPADYILVDVGPNVGPLNRTVLLSSDFFATPVASDLFSLRALGAVGGALAKWMQDWQIVRSIAPSQIKSDLFMGLPKYLGYISSAFKVKQGTEKTRSHAYWENQMEPRISNKLVGALIKIDKDLVFARPYLLGAIKNYQSLPSDAQKYKLALSKLKGKVNPGHNAQIKNAEDKFKELALAIIKKVESHA